jgi:hypothetical protein
VPKYLVSFSQAFEADNKRAAFQKGIAAVWNGYLNFGTWVQEMPEGSKTVCVETDPTTGIKHWNGVEQS